MSTKDEFTQRIVAMFADDPRATFWSLDQVAFVAEIATAVAREIVTQGVEVVVDQDVDQGAKIGKVEVPDRLFGVFIPKLEAMADRRVQPYDALEPTCATVEISTTIDPNQRPPDYVAEALRFINAHRRQGAVMRPLDPVAAGWTDDDVLLYARELGWLG